MTKDYHSGSQQGNAIIVTCSNSWRVNRQSTSQSCWFGGYDFRVLRRRLEKSFHRRLE